MPRWVYIGIGLVLLALAGILFLASERRPSVSSVVPHPGNFGATFDSSNRLTIVDQDRERTVVRESALQESSPEAEIDIATGTPTDEHEPSARIRAVDGITGAGLPGARVSWVSAEETARMQALLADGEDVDFEALVNTSGEFAIADARGEVELPAGSATVVARWRDKVGIEPLHALDSGLIRLWGEYALEVKVVDASGSPRTGIPVQLSTERPWPVQMTDESGALSVLTRDVCWSGVTGAGGIVRIEHAESHLTTFFVRQPDGSFRIGEARGVCEGLVELGIPTRAAAGVRIDPLDWPDGPVVLTLPALGTMVVELVDADGEPVLANGYVHVELVGQNDEAGRANLTFDRRSTSDGRARFDMVQLGQLLRVRARFHGHRPGINVDLEGPTEARPHLELRLVCPRENPLLVGRLLGSDGLALANAWFRLEIVIKDPHGRESRTEMSVRTGTTGSFAVTLRGDVVVGATGTLRFLHPHTGEPSEHADVDLAVIDVARIELGDLRMRRLER